MAHPVQHPSMPKSVNYTPDYQALIQQDPAYAQLQDFLSAQGIQDAAHRQSATQQALIQYGAVPDFSSVANQLGLSAEALAMLQGDIDPNAAALAQGNTDAGLSTQAQLQQNQHQAILSLRNALAAHGALSSGDDAYRTNLQDQSYARAQSDALNALLASIGGYQSTYLDQRSAAMDKLNQGVRDAMTFESGLPQNQGFHLKYDSKTGTYKDASGNTYTIKANGSGGWTLTNGATGGVYTLGANGQLTNGVAPPAPPQTPGGGPVPPGGGNPPPVSPPYGGTNPPPAPIPTVPPPGSGGGVPLPPPMPGGGGYPPPLPTDWTIPGHNPNPPIMGGGGGTPVPLPPVPPVLGGGGVHDVLNPPPTHGLWPITGGGAQTQPMHGDWMLGGGGGGGGPFPQPTHGVLNPPPTRGLWPSGGGRRPSKPPFAI